MIAVILWTVTALLCAVSLVPLNKAPVGAVRALDFPRLQFFWLALLLAAAMLLTQEGHAQKLGVAALAFAGTVQLVHFIRFTPFWRRQSVRASASLMDHAGRRISVLTSNVKQSNRAYGRLTGLIRDADPDIAIAVEVDDAWIEALREAHGEDYPHWVRVGQSNTYGICVMSRLALSDTKVRELVTEAVPSVSTVVTLECGEPIRLFVVHPEPPVLNHDTKGRDSEIALIGLEAKDEPLPSIVTGDLNDVAWSTTTRRFQRLSGLLDPRVGRGAYNTFHAHFPFARWPLDHLFHDARFRLVRIERLRKIGSDHFPMLFELALAETDAGHNGEAEADHAEKREVAQMVREERARDREAIGTDWED